ncbi:MAG: hypothetical protein OXN17_08015 [Candidatus Poribacteria bacterium]|nr:hypothetical protein [Candidatus Poribacteria bacterium]MDE0505841.1 hypothetical protein [Candidatus Poribacteria bacterium]
MIRSIVVALMICCATSVTASQLEDVVYLKDGSVVRGTIIDRNQGQSLSIRTADNRVLTYSEQQILKVARQSTAISEKRGKNPASASCLSCMIPGLGQFYNGEPGKGCLQFGMVSGGLTYAFLVGMVEIYNSFGGGSSDSSDAAFYGSLGVAAVGWLWSVIDAAESAKRINERNEKQRHGHLTESNDVGIGSIIGRNLYGAKVTLRF